MLGKGVAVFTCCVSGWACICVEERDGHVSVLGNGMAVSVFWERGVHVQALGDRGG